MIYIILAMLFYSAALLLAAAASRITNNSNLVGAITNILSASVPALIVAPTIRKILENDRFGLFLAVIAGIFVALFTLALNKAFTTDKVAIITPIVFGGSLFLSSILSYFFFKEKITPIQGAGLVLLGLGLILIIYAKATGR